jgi:hypothetical protein
MSLGYEPNELLPIPITIGMDSIPRYIFVRPSVLIDSDSIFETKYLQILPLASKTEDKSRALTG